MQQVFSAPGVLLLLLAAAARAQAAVAPSPEEPLVARSSNATAPPPDTPSALIYYGYGYHRYPYYVDNNDDDWWWLLWLLVLIPLIAITGCICYGWAVHHRLSRDSGEAQPAVMLVPVTHGGPPPGGEQKQAPVLGIPAHSQKGRSGGDSSV
jgi:hypothetical protein